MMRYAVSFSLAVILLASPARADVLLTEVTKEFSRLPGPCCIVAPESIGWQSRVPEPGIGWNADPASTGVPQTAPIPFGNTINSLYHFYDFSVNNEALVEHVFKWSDGTGLISQAGLHPTALFTTGTYGIADINGSAFSVVSHFTPPNGNSFIGTGLQFTAIELTVDKHIVPVNESDREIIQFTARFYGVPEPATAVMGLWIGLCSLCARRR